MDTISERSEKSSYVEPSIVMGPILKQKSFKVMKCVLTLYHVFFSFYHSRDIFYMLNYTGIRRDRYVNNDFGEQWLC